MKFKNRLTYAMEKEVRIVVTRGDGIDTDENTNGAGAR